MLLILIIVLSFISCSDSDSKVVSYQIRPVEWPSAGRGKEFWSERETFIMFMRNRGALHTKINITLNTEEPYKALHIKELSFEFADGTRGYFLENIRRRIPAMYKLESGHYTQGEKRSIDGFFWLGRFRAEDFFKDVMEVGEKKEMKLTLIYSFDNGPLRTETHMYTVSSFERDYEAPWFLWFPYYYFIPLPFLFLIFLTAFIFRLSRNVRKSKLLGKLFWRREK